jgi:hypothetical protein
MTQLTFSKIFYKTLLGQYFAFVNRKLEYIKDIPDFNELKGLAKEDRMILKDILKMESFIKEDDPGSAYLK